MAYVQPPAPVPRRRGLRIAVVVWAVLTVAVLAVGAVAVVAHTTQPSDQHIPLAGGVVTITEPGEYSVYYETGRASSAELTGITGPDGAPVPADRPGVRETYRVNGRGGVRLASFTATAPGVYRLTGAAEDIARGDELVVGTRTVGGLLAAVFTGAAGVMLLLVGGLVLLTVSRAGRRRTVPPVAGWGGGPAPAGWPPAGGRDNGAAYPPPPYPPTRPPDSR